MTLTCTSRYAGQGAQCQDRQHPDGLHHAHDGDRCLMWTDSGPCSSRPIAGCSYAPAPEIVRRGNESAAKLQARRERLFAAYAENPDDELLRAKVKRHRHKEARTTPAPGPCPVGGCDWDAEGTLDDHLFTQHDEEELAKVVVRLALENDQLRAQLAGVWPCTCSHMPEDHRYDSTLRRNFCWHCKPDTDLHDYEPAPAKTED